MNTNDKSQIAELAVAADLAKRGYTVSIPMGVTSYDLIVDRGGEKLEKVQVKYTTEKDGCLDISLERTSYRREQTISNQYTEDDFDWLAAYSAPNGTVCYIPVDEVAGMRALRLRIEPPMRNYSKINLAESYVHI